MCKNCYILCKSYHLCVYFNIFYYCVQKKYAKNHFYLHISKNSSTFAADFNCRGGGIGRHEGLKILWPVMAVRVQVPPAVLKKKQDSCESLAFLYIILRIASLLHFAYNRRICNKRWVYWPFGCSLDACSIEKMPVSSIFSTFTLPEQCTTLSASNKIPT